MSLVPVTGCMFQIYVRIFWYVCTCQKRLKIGTLVAALPGAERFIVSAGIGGYGVRYNVTG